jgi:polysaccharide export outer membrane protein
VGEEKGMKRASLISVIMTLTCLWSRGVYSGEAYRLGAEDVVRVTVYGHPELTAMARIAEDGSITVPAVGQVSVGGLTAKDAERKLVKILTDAQVVKDAQVGVFVEQYQSKRVTVLGQVAHPGVFPITRGSTLTELISEAGGLSEDAGDVAVITRKRGKTDQQTVVDLSLLLEGRPDVPEPKVGDGDRIFIPRTERFYVYGEVSRPGAYPLERGMTVVQALSVAGGLTDKGTERGMQIRRKTKGDGEEVIPAELTRPIQANDVLHVKESLF